MNRVGTYHPSGRPGGRTIVALLAALGALAALSGCTSDPISNLGYDLVDTEVDVVLEPIGADVVTRYAALGITEEDNPVPSHDVLYFGEQGGTVSSILINYDFADVYSDTFPAEVFTEDNIEYVQLRLLMLEFYKDLPSEYEEEKALYKNYEVYECSAPFDSTAFPGPVPDHDSTDLIAGEYDPYAAYVLLPLDKQRFLDWLDDGGQKGLLVQEGDIVESGLMGFSSRDMRFGASSLPDYNSDIVVGPALVVKFNALPDTTLSPDTKFILSPYADTSTFHEIGTPPTDLADGFMLRTCLRNYPALHFDLSVLPENILINRAVLAVASDTLTSFGNLEAIVVSELDTTLYGTPVDTLTLDELEANVYTASGLTSLDPTLNHKLEFNVTTSVQRVINGVYEGTRGFVLTAGEDVFSNYDLTSVDPDFYFTQFNFFGTAEADTSLRPRLKITYSRVEGVNEKGGR